MIYFVEGFTEVHYYEVSLFIIFKVVKDFLCEAYKLRFAAMFGAEAMLEGV